MFSFKGRHRSGVEIVLCSCSFTANSGINRIPVRPTIVCSARVAACF